MMHKDFSSPFNLHFLKESFMPLVDKYGMEVKLIEGFDDRNGVSDGLLTLFLNFDAPGKEFGVETDEVVRHYWELINYIDEKNSDFGFMSMDPETGKIKPADGHYFFFNWRGEFNTQTNLTIDEETFLKFIGLLLIEDPNNPVFNFDALKKTRIINQFIRKKSI